MSSLQRLLPHTVMTFIACITIASASYAAQPPDVVKSDSKANTAMGSYALFNLTAGAQNTAAGVNALGDNTTGNYNSAFGAFSLGRNTTGVDNSAFGAYALVHNTDGYSNTAVGVEALTFSDIGYWDTAVGAGALRNNSGGSYNSAFGAAALSANQTGIENTALGASALYSNTIGNGNTVVGVNSLEFNTTGSDNTAVGFQALHGATTGSSNIAIGPSAGYYVATGSNNIHIGAVGNAADNGHIRVGTAGKQVATYIAGINGTHVTGAAVYVTSSGQLGVLASSERYKTQVASMGSSTAKLTQLRPVTYRLKSDPTGKAQYGLIAEEVARVYPELVIRDENGVVQGVRYEELAPMLLNEVEKQAKVIDELSARLSKLEEQQAHGSGVTHSH